MVQRKMAVRKPASAGRAAKGKGHPANKAAKHKPRKRAARKSPQPRVWRRVAKLADDGLLALDAGNVTEVRGCLEAIRAVGLCAEQE